MSDSSERTPAKEDNWMLVLYPRDPKMEHYNFYYIETSIVQPKRNFPHYYYFFCSFTLIFVQENCLALLTVGYCIEILLNLTTKLGYILKMSFITIK